MFVEDSDTCWNSDQGLPQFVFIDFQKMVKLHSIQLTFKVDLSDKSGTCLWSYVIAVLADSICIFLLLP